MTELTWIVEAKKYIGLKENTSKTKHNPTIISWLKELGGWWSNDEVPWCGTFIAHCLKVSNRNIPKHWYRAKDYLNYGTKLNKPAYGSIGVMSRTGGGHVTFIIGKTKDGKLACLGGNQNNEVNIAIYSLDRFENFIWPENNKGDKLVPLSNRYELPLYDSKNLKVISSEE